MSDDLLRGAIYALAIIIAYGLTGVLKRLIVTAWRASDPPRRYPRVPAPEQEVPSIRLGPEVTQQIQQALDNIEREIGDVPVVAARQRRENDEWAAPDEILMRLPDPPRMRDDRIDPPTGPVNDTTVGRPDSGVVTVRMAEREPTLQDVGEVWVDLRGGRFYLNDDGDGWAEVDSLLNSVGGRSLSIGDELGITAVINTLSLPGMRDPLIEMNAAQHKRGRVEWADLSVETIRWLGSMTAKCRADFATMFGLRLPEDKSMPSHAKKPRPRRRLELNP